MTSYDDYSLLAFVDDMATAIRSKWYRDGADVPAELHRVARKARAPIQMVRRCLNGELVHKRVVAEMQRLSGMSPPPTTERACLKCRRMFKSAGSHNRMCDECRRGDGPEFVPLSEVYYGDIDIDENPV